jgi:autotransporter-associated beta strand protein
MLGGTNDLGAVTVQRSPSASGGFNNVPLGSEGLVVSNGLVRMTSLDVGGNGGNSWLTTLIAGGDVTNSGAMTVRGLTAGRASRFFQTGGFFESMNADVLLRGHTGTVNSLAWYWVTGGTNLVRGFALAGASDTNGTVLLSNSAKIYIGSGGITTGGGRLANNGTNINLNNGGVFGAQTDWTGTVLITLAGGSFDAAALDGTPHSITLSGVVRGAGALTKTGGGTLTLDAANTYSGNTLINEGTLALGANGSIAGSTQIILSSNTVFDVSAVSGGFTLGDGRTLGGFGVVTGNVALASGAIVNPGNSPGTLTFTNDVSATGGGVFHFDLSSNPSGPSNDFVVVAGTLTVSGINNIDISGEGSPGTVHPLIRYGTFSGSTANFDVVGASGTISNNITTKTLYLIVQSGGRAPTSVVWSGLASQGNGNLWDTEVTTNWVTEVGGTPTVFIPDDHAKFVTAGGGIQTNISLVGTLSPGSGSVTVNSTADYTFGGAGRIGGPGGVTKSNTGTLTVLTTNSYTGPTVIAGGVVVAPILENSAINSSIGAASFDPTNLVLSGGTLRYPGSSVSIDRGATLSGAGGTVDVTNANANLTISGTIAGDGVLTKIGAGTLTLSGVNTYSGGTVISSGTNRLNSTTGAGTNIITLSGGTVLLTGPSDADFPNGLNVTTTSTLASGANNNRLNGPVSGSVLLNVSIEASTNTVFTLNGDITNFTGTFYLGNSIGTFRFNSGGGNTTFGAPNATIDLGPASASLQARNAGTIAVGALLGGPSTWVKGPNAGALVWEIGNKNLDTTYEGTITNAAGTTGLTKVGSGALRLTGTNTYTGITTISGGTLQVDGALGNTFVQVDNGTTLSGNGLIGGSVSVNAGGTLSPGASVGKLTLTNSVLIIDGGNVLVEINKSLALTNDFVDATNGATISVFSGAVTITNIGPPLQAGDKFFLFNQAVSGGSALTVSGAGCTWQNDLESDGSITVLTAPTVFQPVFGSVLKSGNSIIITGSNGPTSGNYIVRSSTNAALPLASWSPIATNPFNPNGTFAFTNAINSAIRQTFYRIQLQ